MLFCLVKYHKLLSIVIRYIDNRLPTYHIQRQNVSCVHHVKIGYKIRDIRVSAVQYDVDTVGVIFKPYVFTHLPINGKYCLKIRLDQLPTYYQGAAVSVYGGSKIAVSFLVFWFYSLHIA